MKCTDWLDTGSRVARPEVLRRAWVRLHALRSTSGRATPFLLLLIYLPALAGCARTQGQPPPMGPPEVKVARPELREVTDFEEFPGRLEAVNSIDVRARVSGYLEKIKFKEGSEVKQGDILFEIDPRSYQADLAKAEGNVVQSEGHLRRLEADLQRAGVLYPKGAMGREDFDKVAGDRVEAKGGLEVAQAARDMARLNMEWTKVRAPQSGRISRRYIDPGNLVKADETVLTTIVSLDPIHAVFDLDERTTLRLQRLIESGKLKWSLDGSLPVYFGLADEEGYPLEGRINFADNRVDSDTGTWRLRALVHNPHRTLAPGMFVRAKLPIGKPYSALLVSEQALGTDQGQKFVYVVEKKEKSGPDGNMVFDQVVYRQVKVGRLDKGLRVISEDVTKDDRVIVSGLQRVQRDMPVKAELLDHMPILSGADKK